MRRVDFLKPRCAAGKDSAVVVLLLTALFLASLTSPLCLNASAEEATDPLSRLEQQFLGQPFAGDARQSRIERLEQLVFGTVHVGNLSERESHLTGLLPSAAPPVLTDAPATTPGAFTPRPGEADYPTVTAMEQKVFGQTFPQEDITQRLERLEHRAFGNVQAGVPLSDRVDQLAQRIPVQPPSPDARTPYYDPGYSPKAYSPPSVLDSLPESADQLTSREFDVYRKLDALESRAFNGQNYTGDMITQRLDRLEDRTFGHRYMGESVDLRMSRLMGALSRGTFPQLPPQTTTTRVPYPAPDASYRNHPLYTGPSNAPGNRNLYAPPGVPGSTQSYRPNIQIGAGMYNTSQSQTWTGPGWESTTRGSGTVVLPPGASYEEEQVFQRFGPPVMQPQTVYPPSGSTTVTPAPYPAFQRGSSLDAEIDPYTGQPVEQTYFDPVAFQQQLSSMEQAVFGQVNLTDSVSMRLSRLEARVLGQNNAGYALEDRFNLIQKALQLQAVGQKLGNGKLGKAGRAVGSFIYGVPLTPPGTPTTETTPATGTTSDP